MSLKKEIQKYKAMSADNNRERIVQRLSAELHEAEEETASYQKQLEETDDIINALKIGVKSIYDKMGCKDELVEVNGISESNIMSYLGIIEQRTSEVL